MNKVYVSGTIADAPMFIQPEGGAAHLVFQLCVRHRTVKGSVKQELYRVNAWNSTAVWGKETLRQGQSIVVQGYLTQRVIRDTGVISVEVTVEEFFPGTVTFQNRRGVETEAFEPQTHAVEDTAASAPKSADIAS